MVQLIKPSIATSTVGRTKPIKNMVIKRRDEILWKDQNIQLHCGDSLNYYHEWAEPTVIVSDGAYGILGFEGDTSNHMDLPGWYEEHIKQWSEHATGSTTLWFWNTEIGWAVIHPILEKHGWRYINTCIWNKGKAHIAGNVNTAKIRRFPVVTEVCAQYVFEPKINNMLLKDWLREEWKRTKLPFRQANDACGVKDAATRKYLDKGHLWYFPPVDMFVKLSEYANQHGDENGKPFFSQNGITPMTGEEWSKMRTIFNCPHGFTNVWERGSLKGGERIKVTNSNVKAAHLNQKPLDLMELIINASSKEDDVVWEPFGGLFSASLAAKNLHRKAFACEIDPDYFSLALQRFM